MEGNGRKPFVKFLSQERAAIAELRAKVNDLLDLQMRRIDEAELKFVKEQEGKE